MLADVLQVMYRFEFWRFSLDLLFWNQIWIHLTGNPVVLAKCSRINRVGLGVCEKISIIKAVCFSVNLVLGVRFLDLRSSSPSSIESSVDWSVVDVVLVSEDSDLMETADKEVVVTSTEAAPPGCTSGGVCTWQKGRTPSKPNLNWLTRLMSQTVHWKHVIWTNASLSGYAFVAYSIVFWQMWQFFESNKL